MKLVKVMKKTDANADWQKDFNNWALWKQEDGLALKAPVDISFWPGQKAFRIARVNFPYNKVVSKKQLDETRAALKKASDFIDGTVAECRKKFPEVKVDW